MAYAGSMNKKRAGGKRRPKVCFFCVDKIEHVDYKDVDRLLGLRPMVVRHMSISLEEK